MTDAVILVGRGTSRRQVRLSEYLDASDEERATEDAIAWIKDLRHARVDGQSAA